MPLGEDIRKAVSRVVPTQRANEVGSFTEGASSVLSFLQNIRRKPVPVQVGVGAAAGLITGYVFTKGSKVTAGFIGCSLIFLQFCNYRGYIKVNQSKLERDVARIRSRIERELGGHKSLVPDEREISNFLSDNAYLLGGFLAGCLIGYGFA